MAEYWDVLYEYLWYFLIYSFLGWCVEVVYAALRSGKVVNRGFLNGPYCPIYGLGMAAILSFFDRLLASSAWTHNGIVIFFGGMVITSAIELFGGWALERLFHIRWWDYSSMPFNLHGYICAKFSVTWGICSVFIYNSVHPTVAYFALELVPELLGIVLLVIFYITFMADIVLTVIMLTNAGREISELDELKKSMRSLSDSLSDAIGESTIRNQNAAARVRVQAALYGMEARDELEEKRAEAERQYSMKRSEIERRYTERRLEAEKEIRERRAEAEKRYNELREKLLRRRTFGLSRLLRTYPGSHHERYTEIFEELKRKTNE